MTELENVYFVKELIKSLVCNLFGQTAGVLVGLFLRNYANKEPQMDMLKNGYNFLCDVQLWLITGKN